MKIFWWLPLVAAVLACQAVGPPQPVKSPNDDREYRYVVLPNSLRALLIHAPGSDRAAAAASVARGSDHDPDAHPGLAHSSNTCCSSPLRSIRKWTASRISW